jgi:hypothetical protein
MRDTGTVYNCLPGQHDDLAISLAMLVWAADHPHFKGFWLQPIEDRYRPRPAAAAGKPVESLCLTIQQHGAALLLTPPNQILPRGHSSLLDYLPLRLPRLATAAAWAEPAAVSRNVGVIRSQRLRFGAAAGRSRAPGIDVGLFSPVVKKDSHLRLYLQ